MSDIKFDLHGVPEFTLTNMEELSKEISKTFVQMGTDMASAMHCMRGPRNSDPEEARLQNLHTLCKEAVHRLAEEEAAKAAAEDRRKLLESFIFEYNLKPSEAELIEEVYISPSGSFVRKISVHKKQTQVPFSLKPVCSSCGKQISEFSKAYILINASCSLVCQTCSGREADV